MAAKGDETGAPPRVVSAYVLDLMDRSKLDATAGVEVRFVRPGADLGGSDLVVVDLTATGALGLAHAAPDGVDVVGFGPHVDDDLLDAARVAGFSRVLPRSAFFSRWPDV